MSVVNRPAGFCQAAAQQDLDKDVELAESDPAGPSATERNRNSGILYISHIYMLQFELL